MSAIDPAIVEAVLYEHREDALTCYDHMPTPDRPVWCCVCGTHELLIPWRRHIADALAPLIAAAVDAARAEAWDEGYRQACRDSAHERYAGTPNPYRGGTP